MAAQPIGVLVRDAAALSSALEGVDVVVASDIAELERVALAAAVIDSSLVDRDALRAFCGGVQALVLAPSDAVDGLIAELPASADIVLAGSPAALIARVLQKRLVEFEGRRDPLTGVLARPAYWRQLEANLSLPGPHALLYFDIDHFKRLNDQHGHLAGDAVLREVAARLAARAPSGAIVARIGGEEFAIYIADDEAAGRELAESLLEDFRNTSCGGIDVRLSAGLVSCESSALPTTVSQHADEALYSAKANGRDCLISYQELAAAAHATDRDVSLDAFESRTKVIAERVAEAITARGRRLFEDLQKRADVDPVTGLYSRGYLDRRLVFELDQARQEMQPLTVALVDLDHFGEVNKTYGWPTGDEALRRVSDALAANVRSSDWVARYGGEELCVVMFGASVEDARLVLERLVHVVSELEIEAIDGRRFGLTVSIGASSVRGDEPAAGLLQRASSCLLEAKRAGRNQLATEPDARPAI